MKRSGSNQYENNKVYVRISTKINPSSRHRFKFQFHSIQIPDMENKTINTTNHQASGLLDPPDQQQQKIQTCRSAKAASRSFQTKPVLFKTLQLISPFTTRPVFVGASGELFSQPPMMHYVFARCQRDIFFYRLLTTRYAFAGASMRIPFPYWFLSLL